MEGDVGKADMDRVAGTFPFKALDTGFGCEKHEIAASSRHYLAMKKLVKDNNFDALAIRCWPEVINIFDLKNLKHILSSCLAPRV